MGCDEWYGPPLLRAQPKLTFKLYPVGFAIGTTLVRADPFSCGWYKDGVALADSARLSGSQSTNLLCAGVQVSDAGNYQLLLTNAYGVTSSAVISVVVHCVDAASTNPLPPFLDWSTAAATIQDAIDAAQAPDFILVTDGLYNAGGRPIAADLTNRVVLDKGVMVLSVNGPQVTVIQGAADPVSTNGPLAVRCAWLTNRAVLSGFTLQGGATRNTGDLLSLQSGGGVWCASTNEILLNCAVTNNAAANAGGGCYQGQLLRCFLWANTASLGGGAYAAYLGSSTVFSNFAWAYGGGVHSSTLVNCTLTGNNAPWSSGTGAYSCKAYNSILYYNYQLRSTIGGDWNGSPANLISCWTPTTPYAFTPDPQLVQDFIHLAAGSPCLGRGNALYSTGTDLDGEPWLNPPPIGCDQYYAADFTGPLSFSPIVAQNLWSGGPVIRNALARVACTVFGKADRLLLSLGDGVTVTNWFLYPTSHTWTNAGDFTVTYTAFNSDNPNGVSTSAVVHVNLPVPPFISGMTLTGSTFQLTFSTQTGVTYYVDMATNLVSPIAWQTLGSLTSYATNATSSDSNATNAMRFYRVRPR